MTIGRMSERVTIQQRAESGTGPSKTESWSTLATVWARVSPLRGGERLQMAAIGSHVLYLVRTYRRSDVTAKNHRLLWRGLTLQILGVRPEEGRRTFLLLDCAEVA